MASEPKPLNCFHSCIPQDACVSQRFPRTGFKQERGWGVWSLREKRELWAALRKWGWRFLLYIFVWGKAMPQPKIWSNPDLIFPSRLITCKNQVTEMEVSCLIPDRHNPRRQTSCGCWWAPCWFSTTLLSQPIHSDTVVMSEGISSGKW